MFKKCLLFFLIFWVHSFSRIEKLYGAEVVTAFNDEKALAIVKIVDERQKNSGDYKATALVKESEKNKDPRLFKANVYRRDQEKKFLIMFTEPKEDSGKAYLKMDKNLWNYEPKTGKWERRTEREKIGGTNSRRSDFDEPNWSVDYSVKAEGQPLLGKFKTYFVSLKVKEGVDVAYPIVKMWIDESDNNLLKREEYSLSGKLMRTSYYRNWTKIFSESKKGDVYVPSEIRIFDELEKGNNTIIVLKDVDLQKLEDHTFTKAWVESKSH